MKKIQLKAKAINIAEPKWVTDVQIQIRVSVSPVTFNLDETYEKRRNDSFIACSA